MTRPSASMRSFTLLLAAALTSACTNASAPGTDAAVPDDSLTEDAHADGSTADAVDASRDDAISSADASTGHDDVRAPDATEVPDAPAPNTTRVEIWSTGMDSVTASIGAFGTVLDATGTAQIEMSPRIQSTTLTLRLERGSDTVDLPTDWSHDFMFLGLPSDTPTFSITLHVMRRRSDGTCVISRTNHASAGGTITGSPDPSQLEDAPCGPFASGE